MLLALCNPTGRAMEYINIIITAIPTLTVVVVMYVIWNQRRRIERIEYMDSFLTKGDVSKEDETLRQSIMNMIRGTNQPSLKLLVELYRDRPERHFFLTSRGNRNVPILRDIQEDMRRLLKSAIKEDDFDRTQVVILAIIDEAEQEAKKLQEKKPFQDLGEPEKSLMIDLLEEIPEEKEIPRQKAFQLAEIIKNKYQNIEKLQLDNKKASTWSRWGAFGTLFFGALSLIQSVSKFFT